MGDTRKPKAAERLARALEEAKAPPAMIRRARLGFYGDFTSVWRWPIHQLVSELQGLGFHDLAKRAMEGEFDGE